MTDDEVWALVQKVMGEVGIEPHVSMRATHLSVFRRCEALGADLSKARATRVGDKLEVIFPKATP